MRVTDAARNRSTVVTPSDPTAVDRVEIGMFSGVGVTVTAVGRSLVVTVQVPQQYYVSNHFFVWTV